MKAKKHKKTDLAYIAGLFDGEGSLGIIKYNHSKNHKGYYRLQLRISNTNLDCLEFVKKVLGFGWVGLQKYKRQNHYKDCYQYMLINKTVLKFIDLIYPYLIIKKEKVDEILKQRYCGAV